MRCVHLILTCLVSLLLTSEVYARPHARRLSILGSNAGSSLATFNTPYWTDGQSVGNLTSTADWVEISGITQPTLAANQAYIWMQSDGSIDKLFAVNKATAASAGELTVGTKNGVDYEDLSSARISGQSFLYLADIGNNASSADSRGAGVDGIIYRIKEPTVTGSNFTISDSDIETIQIVFPGGGSAPSHRDAECLMVDPDTGAMYVITKREAVAGVYSLAHASSYSGIQTLVDEGNMFDIPDVSSASASGNVVGCNISPNGREILVKSYDVMYHFARNKSTQTVMQALQATPTTVDGYVGGGNSTIAKSHPSQEPQGEAVTFDYDGGNYYTQSEFLSAHGSTSTRYPFFKYTRLSSVPTTISFQDGVSPNSGYVGSSDTFIWDTNPNTDNGTATSTVEDKAVGVETDQRKGLHKWDITLIPYGAQIVGARADTFIAAEGQGIAWYRILTADWVESSTYNSLTGGINDDGTEASTTEDNRNAVNLDTILNLNLRNNLRLDTPQAWVSGTQNNYGYLIEGTDITTGDGMQLASREAVTSTQRPKLTLRYTGGYTPEDEASLVRWYSGMYEATETWLADNTAISSWPDRSASNQDATQATAGNRPTLQTRESNSRSVVRFDATDDFFSIPEITLNGDWTIFLVFKSSNVTGNMNLLVDINNANGFISMDFDSGGLTVGNLTSTVTYGGSWTPSIYQIHAIKSDTKWWINGTQQSLIAGAVTENPTMVFNQIGNDANPINGDISEILIFNADLDTAGLNRVGNYLKWAHKLSWTNITND